VIAKGNNSDTSTVHHYMNISWDEPKFMVYFNGTEYINTTLRILSFVCIKHETFAIDIFCETNRTVVWDRAYKWDRRNERKKLMGGIMAMVMIIISLVVFKLVRRMKSMK